MASVKVILSLMVVCVLMQLSLAHPWGGGPGFGGGFGPWGGGYGGFGVVGFGRRFGYGGGFYPPPPPPLFYPPPPFFG